MNRGLVGRLVGEFVVIVVGVLLALAVDDWRQYRQDRGQEAELLARLHTDLAADEADLASAAREVRARLWVLDAVLAELGDEEAGDRLQPERLEEIQSRLLVDSLRAAVGRGPTFSFDPEVQPLGRAFTQRPEFDLSDDAYQEMLATGSLGIVRNDELRSAMIGYYRVAEDQGGNAQGHGEYQQRFEDVLAAAGVAPGDPLTLSELVSRVRQVPAFAVEVRRAANRIRGQLGNYSVIDAALHDLQQRLTLRP